MTRRSLRFLLATTLALTGCSALLDVKDIYFDPNAGPGGGGQDGSVDGPTNGEGGPPGDGGVDAANCVADLQNDAKHCGRCGHDCGGGACAAGVCQALLLTSVSGAPLNRIVASGQYLFVSSRITKSFNVGGVWRVLKTGGNAEEYAATRFAENMLILGDTLYFVNDDTLANSGGLYSCPVVGPSPCTPALIAAAEEPRALTVDNGRIFYGDRAAGKGLMLYAPPAAPVVFRAGFGFPINFFVDGTRAFYSFTFQPANGLYHAKVLEAFTDGGVADIYSYDSPTAEDGLLIADANQFLFTAYDFTNTTGGVVRRIPRSMAVTPCDVGGTGNKRPYGIHTDGARIYWSNQGEGPAEPYTNGSVVSCEATGCCAMPKPMWTGDGEPTALTGDAEFIYFVTYATGGIYKVAKP